MCCREMTQTEIDNVLSRTGLANVSADICCSSANSQMCSFSVRINGDLRLTLEGPVNRRLMNAVAEGEPVTVRYTGRTCMGNYRVTVTGEPEDFSMTDNCTMRFNLTDYTAEGVLRY